MQNEAPDGMVFRFWRENFPIHGFRRQKWNLDLLR